MQLVWSAKMSPPNGSNLRVIINLLCYVFISISVRGLKDAKNELQQLRANVGRFNNSLLFQIGPCSEDVFNCRVNFQDRSRARNFTAHTDVASAAMAAYASFYQLNGVTIANLDEQFTPSPDLGTFRMRDEPMVFFGLLPQAIEVLRTSFSLTVPIVNINQEPLSYANEGKSIRDLVPRFQGGFADPLYVIVHDWLSLSTEPLITSLQDALLKEKIFPFPAVLIVNWEIGAQTRGVDWTTIPINQVYAQAAVNSVLVGHELGLVLYNMFAARLVEHVDVHIIGHGLGGQVAHFAGEWFQRLQIETNLGKSLKVGRITGLNPSALGFQGTIVRDELNVVKSVFLNEDDASFVDIIATGRVRTQFERLPPFSNFLTGSYGYRRRTGHVMFYANDGNLRQPFCRSRFEFGCEQDSSLFYFVRSVLDRSQSSSQKRFLSVNCENYAQLKSCRERVRRDFGSDPRCYGTMGIDAFQGIGRGLQFLDFDPTSNGQAEGGAPVAGEETNQLPRFKRRNEEDDQLASRQAIDRFPNTEQVDNVQLNMKDSANCGLFRKFPGPPPARMLNGDLSYRGQFPWSVCIFIMQFTYRSMLVTNVLFRDPQPVFEVDQVHKEDRDRVLSGEDEAWKNVTNNADCSGSLIHAQWVVTAAHCFNSAKNGIRMSLSFGGVSCQKPVRSVTMTIEKRPRRDQNIFIPEAYLRTLNREAVSYRNYFSGNCTQERGIQIATSRLGDIALIKLPEPLDIEDQVTWPGTRSPKAALNTICWHSAELFNYEHLRELFVSAYGSKGANVPKSPDLNWMKIQIVRRRIFLDTNNFYVDTISNAGLEGFFQAVNLEPVASNNVTTWSGKAIAGGDSGGPYHWYVRQNNVQNNVVADSRAVLVGVTNTGFDVPLNIFNNVTRLQPSGVLMVKSWLQWMKDIVRDKTDSVQPNDQVSVDFDPQYLSATGEEGDYEKP